MTEPNLEPAPAKAEEPSDGGSLVVNGSARTREEPAADESGPVRKSRLPSRTSVTPRALAARSRERRVVPDRGRRGGPAGGAAPDDGAVKQGHARKPRCCAVVHA